MRKQMLYISSAVLFTSILLGGCNNPNKHACNYSFEQRLITLTTEPSNAKVTLAQPFGQPGRWMICGTTTHTKPAPSEIIPVE